MALRLKSRLMRKLHENAHFLFNTKFRLAWAAGSVVATVVFMVGDWMLREWDYSFLAPTETALYESIGLGAMLGLVRVLWERYLLYRQRQFMLAISSAPVEERLRWKYQRENLLLNGWLLLAMLVLLG